jgi:hypothetical protein
MSERDAIELSRLELWLPDRRVGGIREDMLLFLMSLMTSFCDCVVVVAGGKDMSDWDLLRPSTLLNLELRDFADFVVPVDSARDDVYERNDELFDCVRQRAFDKSVLASFILFFFTVVYYC